jgi:poly(A)-specific ribonuclease
MNYACNVQSVKHFMPTQIGICLVLKSADPKKFTFFPYNFFVAPAMERSFTISVEAMRFLRRHSFSFDHWIDNSIPFLSKAQEERKLFDLQRKQDSIIKEAENPPPPLPDISPRNEDEAAALKRQLEGVEAFVQSGAAQSSQVCDSPFLRRLVYQNVRKLYPDVYMETVIGGGGKRELSLFRMSPNDVVMHKLAAVAEERKKVMEDVGFRHFMDALCASKKPVVVHNGWLDVLHVTHNFVSPLPETVVEGKKVIREAFGTVYDTKVCAHVGATHGEARRRESAAAPRRIVARRRLRLVRCETRH